MSNKFKKYAEHSLKEAAQRKEKKKRFEKINRKKEINGPQGLEPTRYGDWETKGITYDF
jgi:hypothetical protein